MDNKKEVTITLKKLIFVLANAPIIGSTLHLLLKVAEMKQLHAQIISLFI